MFVIFGASGNAGRAAATKLRAAGLPVRAVVRDKCSGADLAALGCEIVAADLNDQHSVEAALDGALAVQVLCPVVTVHAQPAQAMRHMIDVLADALAVKRPAHVLAISDYGAELAEGTGITEVFHYLEQRLLQQAKACSTALTLLRSAEHMQNWKRVAKRALETGELISFHDPVTKRFPTVAAQDIGRIAADLMTDHSVHAGTPRIVHAEGPERIDAHDVARTLAEISGRAVLAKAVPRAQRVAVLSQAGLGAAHVQLLADLYDAHNAGRIDIEAGVGEVRFGTTTLAEVLGATLRRPFESVS
jgi:NAD(P)H dehydrogenase (quinone)